MIQNVFQIKKMLSETTLYTFNKIDISFINRRPYKTLGIFRLFVVKVMVRHICASDDSSCKSIICKRKMSSKVESGSSNATSEKAGFRHSINHLAIKSQHDFKSNRTVIRLALSQMESCLLFGEC